jgi:hypothetical protein
MSRRAWKDVEPPKSKVMVYDVFMRHGAIRYISCFEEIYWSRAGNGICSIYNAKHGFLFLLAIRLQTKT